MLADATPWLHAIAAASPVQTTPARNQRPLVRCRKVGGFAMRPRVRRGLPGSADSTMRSLPGDSPGITAPRLIE